MNCKMSQCNANTRSVPCHYIVFHYPSIISECLFLSVLQLSLDIQDRQSQFIIHAHVGLDEIYIYTVY